MAQLEETLGGMRIIKAFTAEEKMVRRFEDSTNENRRLLIRVNLRQSMAHPVSEFLGTVLIVLVLWYGGTLIFSNQSSIDAPTFIFYMVILYSLIQPLKDFSKAAYNIPKGMASVERVNNRKRFIRLLTLSNSGTLHSVTPMMVRTFLRMST